MKNLHKNIGIFAASLLAASSAVYIYSPVIGSHADSSATADINLSVGEVMNLTLDTNSIDLNATLNSFVSGVINATASTNSQYGYTLTLEDVDSNTNLVHANENIDAVVSSNFSGSKTSSEMEANTWGFSLDATNFSKIPANGSAATIKTTNAPMTTASETTPVTFGAKVGNLTSGTYTDKVLFTAYTNGQSEEPTMQEFSCDSLENTEDSVVLKDSRDGNSYTVKKLADGKCWMTENLRIKNVHITSQDSNLPEGEEWDIPESSITGFNDYNQNQIYVHENNGGYYSFYAVTAGWGVFPDSSGTSPKDICPKGWRLPTGGSGGEFSILYRNYYNSTPLLEDEPGFTRTGYINYSSLTSDGALGAYWSATVDNRIRSYYLDIFDTGAWPENSQGKEMGLQVRCVAK